MGKDDNQKRTGGGGNTFLYIVGVVLAVFVARGGNPMVQVQRIITMAKGRVATKVDLNQWDDTYEGVASNDQHNAYDADVADNFYNLATDFYEYGWGDSFHFGFRRKGEPHEIALRNSQNFVATQLHVKNGDRVLDMGCGIGGPLRGVVRATGANVTGLTINQYQVDRAYAITRELPQWMQDRSNFVVQDYLDVKGMEEGAYDAAFYMESSLHTEDRTKTFQQTYKLLKPGGRLVAMEYNLLPGWKPEDPEHQRLMQMHLHGNGAAKTPTIEEDLAMFKAAGFEVQEHYDFANLGDEIYGEDNMPWWADLQFNWYFQLLPAHPWIRRPLPYVLRVLAALGVVPKDVPKVAELMNEGGDGLSGLGKLNAITPQYYVLAIKPE